MTLIQLIIIAIIIKLFLPSVLWHCRLDGRKSTWPVKIWSDEVLVWLSCLLYTSDAADE